MFALSMENAAAVRNRLPRMAEPARQRPVAPTEEPPVDPTAIDRAYRAHRARRRARVEHRREQTRARLRFVVATVILVACVLTLFVLIWREVQSVFGL